MKVEKITGVAVVAALILLVVWLGILVWMGVHRGEPDREWARLVTLLASLEAVVFAAAGALFGTTVQKGRVAAAERQAKEADERAVKAAEKGQREAANGRALASAVKERLSAGGAKAAASPNDALLTMAMTLFPD